MLTKILITIVPLPGSFNSNRGKMQVICSNDHYLNNKTRIIFFFRKIALVFLLIFSYHSHENVFLKI